jgi:hypothetical protein
VQSAWSTAKLVSGEQYGARLQDASEWQTWLRARPLPRPRGLMAGFGTWKPGPLPPAKPCAYHPCPCSRTMAEADHAWLSSKKTRGRTSSRLRIGDPNACVTEDVPHRHIVMLQKADACKNCTPSLQWKGTDMGKKDAQGLGCHPRHPLHSEAAPLRLPPQCHSGKEGHINKASRGSQGCTRTFPGRFQASKR